MIKKIIISVIGISLAAPFVFTVFFLRTADFFLGLIINLGSFMLLVTFNVAYFLIEKVKGERLKVTIISLGVVIFFFLTYGVQIETANYLYFKFKESSMNDLVNEIRTFGKISSMTNMERNYKEINGEYVVFYKEYINYHNIDTNRFEDIRKQLVELGVIRFELKYRKIYFVTGGFIDSESGYVYSDDGTPPLKYEGGGVFDCQKVAENWYYFYED
jgi:hypothetical protein